MLTIYGVYRSRATRPLWLLHEIGCDFRHVPVIQGYRLPDASAADAPINTASAEFLAINPQGQIPVMVEDGLILTESLAIAMYIARRHGGPLGPKSDAEAGLIAQWALFAATSIETPAIEILYAPEGDMGQAVRQVAAEKLRRPMARVEQHLAGRDWLLGGRFSVADIMLAECLRYAQSQSDLFTAHPAVNDWITRCQARDAFQAMWAKRQAEPA